jgi:hypothetical protein
MKGSADILWKLTRDEQGLSMGGDVDGEFPSNLEYLLYIGFDYDLQLTHH